MSAASTSKPKTVEDLLALEAETDERYEIIDGEFVEVTVSDESSETNSAFGYHLFGFVTENRLGRVYDSEMIYELPKSIRKADVSAILADRVPRTQISHFAGAPDVVVEVISPSDRWADVRNKVQEWLDAGARIVWLAAPSSGEVTVYRRGQRSRTLIEGEVLDGEDVLPGFSVEVSRLVPSRAESRQEMSREG